MLKNLLADESGFIVSAELALIVTLVFTAAAVGVAVARDALVSEYNDLSEMFGVMDQGYHVSGQSVLNPGDTGVHGTHGANVGFGYNDGADDCDCQAVVSLSICGKNDPSGIATSEQGL